MIGSRRPAAWAAVAFAALAVAWPARAQLDENCVVSVLNRTTQVKPDGTWIISNVPTNAGRVRVRATCVENGVTRSGQSDYVLVPANGSIAVPDVIFDSLQPIPSSLTLSAPAATLAGVGASEQLTATAAYPDSHTADVTHAAQGTTYFTSNARVVSVSVDGLVTGVASGPAIVGALNEGALGLTRITVTGGIDSDGDGMPDDYEIANGFNPNDPSDAVQDADGDGLANLVEYQLGTNPRNPDTDGDGIRDRLEIQTGSNPLDPTSYDLARALQSLEVTPASIPFSVNTIMGEVSQQLQVTGHLIDGFTINLTSTSRRTTYTSSNLLVANFGATDGLVFAGQNGSATISVANSGFSAAVAVTVSNFSPTALSQLNLAGRKLDVSGDFVYVAGSSGLLVVDVTDRRAPRQVGQLSLSGLSAAVKVVGNRAYVAGSPGRLSVVDVSNPSSPTLLGTIPLGGDGWDLAVTGNRAYLAGGSAGLQIIDVSDPTLPRFLGSLGTPGSAQGVDVSGTFAYVAAGTAGLQVINVSNPAASVIVGALSGGNAQGVTVAGGVAYVADVAQSLKTVDVSVPAAPRLLATTPPALGGLLNDIRKQGRFVLGADIFFVNGVPIVDVTNPAAPVPRARLDFPGDFNATGIAADVQYVYLMATGASGSALFIGQYLLLSDTAGIPPTVTLTSPLEGQTVIEGTSLVLAANASDDVAVGSVQFLLNGSPVSTDFVSPYEAAIVVPSGTSSLTVGAVATDLSGNTGTASPVHVNVIPNATTVVGRVLDSGGQPIGGAAVTAFQQFSGQTGANGRFSLSDVPAYRGNIVITATATIAGKPFGAASRSVAPVVGGTIDVGDIVLHRADGPLYPVAQYPVGNTPNGIAVGDFNGDLIPDIVTANGGSGDVTVLLGNGDGTYQAARSFPVGNDPDGVAIGDFNGDGKADIVATAIVDNKVSVLLGNGDGTFQTRRVLSTGTYPYAVAVGDFNGDGKLDIATANAAGNNVSVILGNGDGTFQGQHLVSVGTYPVSIAARDLNGDGRIDLIVNNANSNDVSVLIGNGDGTFQAQRRSAAGQAPQTMGFGDFNADGVIDLVTNNGNAEMTVLLGRGDGTFLPPQTYPLPSGYGAVTVADFNGDGKADVLSTGNSQMGTLIFFGRGDGTFAAPVPMAFGGGGPVVAADLNADGAIDFVSIRDNMSVVLGRGDGTFVSPLALTTGQNPLAIAVGDVNGDGKLDLVTSNQGAQAFDDTDNDVSLLLGNGDGTFLPAISLAQGKPASAVALADVNGDGKVDLLRFPWVYPGNGDGTFAAPLQFPGTGGRETILADLNGDGRPDVIFRIAPQEQSQSIGILLSDPVTVFRPMTTLAGSSTAWSGFLAVGDVNRDGRPDILVSSTPSIGGLPQSTDLKLFYGNGNGTFQSPVNFNLGVTLGSLLLSDVNGDGILDLISVSYSLYVALGNPNGTFQAPRQFGGFFANPTGRAVLDVNDDGIPDIVVADYDSSDIAILLGNGDGSFQTERRFFSGFSPMGLVFGDFNGDGRPDMARGNLYPGVATVFIHR